MPIGPKYYPEITSDHGVAGVLNRVSFTVLGLVGGLWTALKAASSAAGEAIQQQTLHRNPDVALSPSLAATAAVKQAADLIDLIDEAQLSGVSPERFQLMIDTTGNPPGPETLLDQWRRKLISDDEFDHGLRTGLLRNEWIPFFRNLRHVPLPPHSYLQAAVEGHMSLPDAIAKVDGLGVDATDANLVYETLGNPPGIVQMLHLWKRGLATEADVDQAIRESHYKNKYIPFIKAYAEYFPPPRTITALLHNGAFTPAQAHDYLMKAGLSDELATAYVASALHTKMSAHKELSAATVTQLYEDRLITRDQAIVDLAKIAYAPAEANLLLDLAEAKAKQKIRTEAINGVQALYKAFKIDEAVVHSDLATIGVPPDHVDDLLSLWKITRALPSKTLTVAQLQKAYKDDLITRDQFIVRAVQIGYLRDDADLLASLVVDVRPPKA